MWLPNSRGNTYSRVHTNLTTADAQFWRFSFDEMALEDLPACIDYALNATGAESLVYGGHSQGATVGLAAFSALPGLRPKVRLACRLLHPRASASVLLPHYCGWHVCPACELLPASTRAFIRQARAQMYTI